MIRVKVLRIISSSYALCLKIKENLRHDWWINHVLGGNVRENESLYSLQMSKFSIIPIKCTLWYYYRFIV